MIQNRFIQSTMLALSAFALSSCGGKEGDKNVSPQDEVTVMTDGKYYLGAATLEMFDANGNKLDPTTYQVTGDYNWTVKAEGGNRFEITATGASKFLINNQLDFELNCNGARDVISFELTASNEIRGIKVINSGCAQGFNLAGATQLSIETLNANRFQFTFAGTGQGQRYILVFSFSKN